jgi:hypothetical protein
MVDVLVVVDNSSTMALEQRTIARGLAGFVRRLETLEDGGGSPVDLSAHMMVTTTDIAGPLCPDVGQIAGAPISSPCTERLADFSSPDGTVDVSDVCLAACPNGAAPDDAFVAFGGAGAGLNGNVGPLAEVDIDGDGQPESAAAQALTCLGLSGIAGCTYASPLEATLRALDPDAAWNNGAAPFRRSDALLSIVLITDGVDCSVGDAMAIVDPALEAVDPDTGLPARSEAICWNAGVVCDAPDADGVLSNCNAGTSPGLRPVSAYQEFFDDLLEQQGVHVLITTAVGIPPVTEHHDSVPFEPVAGGVLDLEFRTWRDGPYPGGDLVADDVAAGLDAADKQFEFGIGPGCTEVDDDGSVLGQATPPVRIREVCESVNGLDGRGDLEVRCCMESICDPDFGQSADCLTTFFRDYIIGE